MVNNSILGFGGQKRIVFYKIDSPVVILMNSLKINDKSLYIITLLFILLLSCNNITAQRLYTNNDIKAPEHLYHLGLDYLNGNGVTKDKQNAYSHFLRAAILGHAEAQYRLGKSYDTGEFTDFDWYMGAYWYKKAAAQKHLAASLILVDKYDRGNAKPESSQEVKTLYNNVLDSVANTDIMLLYGHLYHYGRYGTTENIDSAKYWYNKALEYGNERAQTFIDQIANNIKEVTASTVITDEVIKVSRDEPIKRNCIAFIIGNSDYSEGYLPNPINDIRDINKKLKALGFITRLYTNLTSKEFRDSVFLHIETAEKYETMVFYYAGHAIQRENTNYMIPIDADSKMTTQELLGKCIRVDEITDLLNPHNKGNKIIILDACRDNKYLARSSRGGIKHKGLSSTTLNTFNSFIVYATQPGEIALDGITGSKNSPFAKALIEELDRPNVPIYKLFDNVKNRVTAYTDGEQTPVYMNNLKGSFVFNRQ